MKLIIPPLVRTTNIEAVLGCTTVLFERQICPKVKHLTMSTNKAALKSIGSAIQARNYDDAVSQAQKLLANDPQHYQGFVTALFLIFGGTVQKYQLLLLSSILHR